MRSNAPAPPHPHTLFQNNMCSNFKKSKIQNVEQKNTSTYLSPKIVCAVISNNQKSKMSNNAPKWAAMRPSPPHQSDY